MKKKRKRSGLKVGVAPGTLQIDADAPKPVLVAFGYDQQRVVEKPIKDLAEVAQLRREWPVVWLNVDGLGDAATLQGVADMFGLHPLAIEDVVNTQQRPKVETYEHCNYVVLRMITLEGSSDQMSLFFGADFVLTFQEQAGDCFDNVRAWLKKPETKVRQRGADFLAYSLIDALIDHYFPMLEALGDHIEALQDEVVSQPTNHTVLQITAFKRDLLRLRRAIWPLRDELSTLTHGAPFVQDDTITYLRDCYDHTLLLIDTMENLRDVSSGLMDIYLSTVSNRMNEIMKTLTIIATIFIPLTFITSLYGMNFDPHVSPYNMPELRWYWGYFGALASMVFTAVAFTVFMWRKGYFKTFLHHAPRRRPPP